jgi:hypothetical protein
MVALDGCRSFARDVLITVRPGRMLSPGSIIALSRRFSQTPCCFHVPNGRQAEHPAIFARELLHALVADRERRAARRQILLSGDVAHYRFNMEHHFTGVTNDPANVPCTLRIAWRMNRSCRAARRTVSLSCALAKRPHEGKARSSRRNHPARALTSRSVRL